MTLSCQNVSAEPAFVPVGERTNHIDGSSDMSLWLKVPATSAKLGADFALRPDPTQTARAAAPATDQIDAAWMKMSLEGAGRIAGYRDASLELRVESEGDESSLAASASRVLVAGDGFSLSLGQSAWLSRSVDIEDEDDDGAPLNAPLRTVTTSLDSSHELKLTLPGTGTAFSVSTSLAPDTVEPQPTFGAEQRLLGGLTVHASFSRDDEGHPETSLSAGFKHSW